MIFKKVISTALVGLALFALPVTGQAAEKDNNGVVLTIGNPIMMVNNSEVTLDAAPVVKHSRTYLPLRALAESLGAEVVYNAKQSKVEVNVDGKSVSFRTDSNVYLIDGQRQILQTAPYINEVGRTMVPVRMVSEGLGFSVEAHYNDQGLTDKVFVNR